MITKAKTPEAALKIAKNRFKTRTRKKTSIAIREANKNKKLGLQKELFS